MIVVEWAIPISALILSGAAVLISVISHRGHAQQAYAKALEGRIALLEKRLDKLTRERDHLMTEVQILRAENRTLRKEVATLRQRLNHLSE